MNDFKQYKIERLNKERINDLTILSKAVYGKASSKYFFDKKFNTSFIGVVYLGFLAYYNNQPVAFFGVIPCFIKYENKTILAAQAVNAMTMSGHRNGDLFVTLVSFTTDLCKKESIKLLFGFPNQHSKHGLKQVLNWQQNGEMKRFTFPVKTLPIERISKKLYITSFIYNIYINMILKSEKSPFHGLNNSLIEEGFAGILRDKGYLNYKTLSKTYRIKINQAEVWFKIKNGLIVGDISNIKDNFDSTFNYLIKLSKYLGIKKLEFQVNSGTNLFFLLEKKLQPEPSFPILLKNIDSSIPIDKIKFSFADIDIF